MIKDNLTNLTNHEICAKAHDAEPFPRLKEPRAWSLGGRPLGLAGVVGLFMQSELVRTKPTDVIIIPLKKVHDKKYIPEQLISAPKSWKWDRKSKSYSIPLNLYETIQYFETHPDFTYVEDNYWAMS